MKTNETLDGSTAGFVAAVANALGRNISTERMKCLIANPTQLQMLLLPVANESWIGMLPAVSYLMNGHVETCGSIRWFTLSSASTSNPPTMRRVLQEAYERKLAPLHEGLKEQLWNASVETDRVRARSFQFVYRREKLAGMNVAVCRSAVGEICAHDYVVDLDEIDETILGLPFIFMEGNEDRSNCFKC